MSDCFVATISSDDFEKLKNDLLSQGFSLSNPINTILSAKKEGIHISLYKNGKITVQGKNKKEWIEFYLEPEILHDISYTYASTLVDKTPRMGCDEAGKGDFFGPLCVCCAYADSAAIEQMGKWGIKDSKKLSDISIHKLALQIKTVCQYKILVLSPLKYNELYGKIHNLNRLLAWAHMAAIKEVHEKTGCKKAVLDQFAPAPLMNSYLNSSKLDVDLVQFTKAESDIVVAAASILARDAFVTKIDDLSRQFDIKIPKGASNQVIEAAKKIVARYSVETLREISKTHFKTYEQVINSL